MMPGLGAQDFANAAHRALKTGGVVRMDSKGRPTVRGSSFFGRAAVWLKQRIFPNKAQAANMQVLASLEQTLHNEFARAGKVSIQQASEQPLSHRRVAESILDAVKTARSQQRYTPQETLAGEMSEATRLGYVANIFQAKECPIPELDGKLVDMPDKGFKFVVGQYNATMQDLHTRFPRLRDIPPPNLSQGDVGKAQEGYGATIAFFSEQKKTLLFSNLSRRAWQANTQNAIMANLAAPKTENFQGVVSHEYGHYLSVNIVPQEKWLPKLAQTFKDNGIMPQTEKIKTSLIHNEPYFDAKSSGNIKALIGEYGASAPDEFVAEALAWYMAPEYGKSIAKMPKYLEQWLQDSFYFLRD